MLYRSHSARDLDGVSGIIVNPYLNRERKPRNIPENVHGICGQWFLDRFGVNYRSKSLFCTGDLAVAKGYANVGARLVRISPVGEFRLCFGNCKDLFASIQFLGYKSELCVSNIYDLLETLEYKEYINCGLDLAEKSGNEIMLVSDRYKFEMVSEV